MQIGICDDQREARERIAGEIMKMYPEAKLRFYESGDELLNTHQMPDILFLDIQMPGTGGMETAVEIRKKNRQMILIFVTALEDYVFQAFDVGAFHYLVKPFTEEKFAAVLKRALEQCQEFQKLEALSGNGLPGFMVTAKGAHITVRMEEIVYAEVFNRKIILHTLDSDIEYYGKMKELEKMAGEDFYRPHRAYLVNFNYIKKYDASVIDLERGQALMAKQNYHDFVKSYLRYNRKKGNW